MTAPRLTLIDAAFFERPVTLRLPFRFGVVTLTEAPQAFVRAAIRLSDGRTGAGWAAELLAPKWFDKSPALTNEHNFDQLRRSLRLAKRHLAAAGPDTAFGLSAAADRPHRDACRAEGLNGLVASFGLALLERAIIDALARVLGVPAVTLVNDNRLGVTAQETPDLEGFDLDACLRHLLPASEIAVRHTVGMVDALTRAETAGRRLEDGLPESLEEAIACYGHRHFKLKVSGDLPADLARLCAIAAVLDGVSEPYVVTLDGNEQFTDVGGITELWRRIGETPRLERLRSAVAFIEQPIARDRALSEAVHGLAARVPLEVDESDADITVFPRARALGYRGISTKSCKGFYRGLLNRARVALWNADNPAGGFFLSAEDLTTQSGEEAAVKSLA